MSIEFKNIVKTYDQSPVLESINAEIANGEFFAIVGPSGCGKSTLLRMLAGLIDVTDGVIKIDGQTVNNVPPKDRKLTMVFQDYALFPFLTVEENIAFGLKARKMPETEISQRVTRAVDMVGLADFRSRKPKDLSGGQRQRIALARAIASDAKICLMDEPLSNLDAQLRDRMRTEIRALQRKLQLTLIYVTHDQIEAMTMADHIMVLNDHHVQQIDTPLGIYNHPANEFVANFFGSPQINFLSGSYKEHEREIVIDTKLRLPIQNQLTKENYLVGIRPNQLDFQIAKNNGGNASLTDLTNLGSQTLLTARLDNGQQLRLTKSEQISMPINQRIDLHLKGQAFIFDPEKKNLAAVSVGVDHG
ncbi:MAG: ABC transporter ATP-binding protein [Oenococcus sp.]|uniref:ABC transporter ATP-binding protein n=1 Tax=Oenococcus TaxID=46254 RepID=UPI0021E7E3EB|nr:ABC transporter ATP-binding protein [Oenococcus kitaharae]MCV3296625.1 ABC transporter ATP-binding protein [Oenococcus kitaharae]